MMISVLERFKTGMGYPWVPRNIETMEDWVKILDIMIDGFKASIEMSEEHHDPEVQTYAEWLEPLQAKHKRGMKLFTKYYQNLWD